MTDAGIDAEDTMRHESLVTALGYIGVRSTRLDDWSGYATGLLGMMPVERAGGLRTFRMDDRKQRLVVTADEGDGLAFLGWEVADAAALDRLVFADPVGHRLEAFHGAEIASESFTPGRPIAGFRTGPLGMGHAVLNVEDVEPLLPFYRDLLGFHVSDYGLKPYKLYFFHVNGRHHSFAFVGSGKRGLHHFMVELQSLDDVGQGYDLAGLEEGRIAYTLGRHTNDWMTSFYSHSPSGFFVEYGWDGRVIDPRSWTPHETFDGPSFWGHERLYLPPDQRARLRDMRLSAAARGVRAAVDAPNCMLLEAVIARE